MGDQDDFDKLIGYIYKLYKKGYKEKDTINLVKNATNKKILKENISNPKKML